MQAEEIALEEAAEVIPHDDPLTLFDAWLAEAGESEPNDPNAMALATATADGRPSVRMVLLKDHGPDGFIFYTNSHSRKGMEIAANPHASLLFHWKSLRRQVRVDGPLTVLGPEDADAYFHSRARQSQLGAVASDQSQPLDARATFIARYRDAEARFTDGEVDRPPHWLGFSLRPERIEFWQDRPYRLHERRLFTAGQAGAWTSTGLYP